MAVASARLHSEAQDDRIVVGPASRPTLTLVSPAMPKYALRCHWEYRESEKRLVQIWETRPE